MNIDDIRLNLQQIQTLAAQSLISLDAPPPTVLYVKQGESLQKAVDAAVSNSNIKEIRVYPDTYDGLILSPRSTPLTIRPDTDALPAIGTRIDPSFTPALIKLRATLNNSAIVAPSGAQGYTIIGVQPLPGADPSYAMIVAGDPTETDPTKAARDLVFDHCLLLADPLRGGKRGIAANCGNIAVINCYMDDFWWSDDSQCVAGANGPGPFLIENNFLCASGENIIFGGADPKNQAMQPTHLTARRNLCTKKLSWRGLSGHTIKNAFELKNMIGALIDGNIFEYSWNSGQVGALVLLTPRNQDGHAPYSTTTDIVFQYNVARHGGAGFQIQGDDNEKPSARLVNLQILNNLFYDIDSKIYNNPISSEPSTGRLLQITRGPLNVEIAHNTMIGTKLNSFLSLDGPQKTDGLNLHDNVLSEGSYGIKGGPVAGIVPLEGAPSWDAWTVNSSCVNNLIQRQVAPTSRVVKYPAGNVLSTVNEVVTDPITFEVIPKYARAGLGVDLTELVKRTGSL